MKKIAPIIIEEGLKENEYFKYRKTVRAVNINHNKVLMIYSKLFDDYTFPGGGVKDDENMEDALLRELAEETGAYGINILKEIGYVTEIKYGLSGKDSIYKQDSFYYLCELEGFLDKDLKGREKEQGLESVYVDIDFVIKHNNNIMKIRKEKGLRTVLKRENSILKHLKEEYNEKI